MKIFILSVAFFFSTLIIQAQPVRPSSIIDSSFYVNSQGDLIFCRKWRYQGNYMNRKVILIIHGLGSYGDPYRRIMNYIKDDSICVYAMDLRGHGLSGNTKGNLESNGKVLNDIENVIGAIKAENPVSGIYLAGVSMGGVYALGYVLKDANRSGLAGLILVGIGLKVHKSQVLQAGNLKLIYPYILNRDKPVIDIDGKRIGESSDEPEFFSMRKKDTLFIHKVSWNYIGMVKEMQRTCRNKSALADISMPVLIQQGGKDRIIDMKGPVFVNRNMKNAETNMIVYSQSHHNLFWDIDSGRVFTDMLRWVARN